jgi:hypothetical protein
MTQAATVLLTAFFIFAACMSGTSAITLTWPGTALDVLWRVNPEGHAGLSSAGSAAVVLMVAVSAACAAAAFGVSRRTRWGYRTALAIFAVNGVGDFSSALVMRHYRGLVGLPIVLALVAWLWRHAFPSDATPGRSISGR